MSKNEEATAEALSFTIENDSNQYIWWVQFKNRNDRDNFNTFFDEAQLKAQQQEAEEEKRRQQEEVALKGQQANGNHTGNLTSPSTDDDDSPDNLRNGLLLTTAVGTLVGIAFLSNKAQKPSPSRPSKQKTKPLSVNPRGR